MRMTTCLLLVACLFSPVALEQRAQAQVIIFSPPKKVERYKNGYEEAKKRADELTSDKAFEAMKFKDKKTGKVLTFTELPDFQQKVILITALEKETKALTSRYDEWAEDLGGLKKAEGEKLSEKLDETANHTDVAHYKDKLLTLRKEVAVKYEAAAVAFFEKYSEKFTKEETQGYLAQMRRYHDTQKLIERKK